MQNANYLDRFFGGPAEDKPPSSNPPRRPSTKPLGVAVHCGAGLGRTGVVLACYFVTKGLTAQSAIARVRRIRPGSIETDEQAEAVEMFERNYRTGSSRETR